MAKKTQRIYFGEAQEQAVVRFLASDSEYEKNKIFNEYLKEPLGIMVDSIIRRYKLHRKEFTFEENHTDTMSFLFTKVDKFKPDKNKKAYSYFGTICKHYLMGMIYKDSKENNRKVSYEDISSSIEDRADMQYCIDDYEVNYTKVTEKLAKELEDFIYVEELNGNELKLGYALVDIFNNYEQIFDIGSGNKFNKNLILLVLREMTDLTTKEIRVAMKKYKKLYSGILEQFLNY